VCRPARGNPAGAEQRELEGVALGGPQVAAQQCLERLAGIPDLLGFAGEVSQVLEAPADDGGQQRILEGADDYPPEIVSLIPVLIPVLNSASEDGRAPDAGQTPI
jgi:hypothetical protein